MLFVKYSNRTKQQCKRRHVLEEDLENNRTATVHTVEKTRFLLTNYESRLRTVDRIWAFRSSAAQAIKEEAKKTLDD